MINHMKLKDYLGETTEYEKKEMLEKGSNAEMEQFIKAIEGFTSTLKDNI